MLKEPSKTETQFQIHKTSNFGSQSKSLPTLSQLELQKEAAQLQYNVLMKNPQLLNDSLNFKLFLGNLNSNQALFHITNIDKRGKISVSALCPNQFIQKLRILYFVILTEAYCSLRDFGEKDKKSDRYFGSCGENSGKNNDNLNQNYCKKSSKLFQEIVNSFRYNYYRSENFSKINKKYLAEFFQFLNLDTQNFKNSQNSSIATDSQNPVIILLNKYPIIDEIFIDGLLYFMSQNLEKNPSNLDDNFNLKSFLKEEFNLSTQFISNWELVIEDIHVIIGVDQFFIGGKIDGYMEEIVESLNYLDNSRICGMDVSRVGEFENNVFEKMECSFIFGIDGDDDQEEMKCYEENKPESVLEKQIKQNQKQNSLVNSSDKFASEPVQEKELNKKDFNISLLRQKLQFTRKPSNKASKLVPQQKPISQPVISEHQKLQTSIPQKSIIPQFSSSSLFTVPLNSSLSVPKIQIQSENRLKNEQASQSSSRTQNESEHWKQVNNKKDERNANENLSFNVPKLKEKQSLKEYESKGKEYLQSQRQVPKIGSFLQNKWQSVHEMNSQQPPIQLNSNLQRFSVLREKRFLSTPFSTGNKTLAPDSTLKSQINPKPQLSSNIPFQKYQNNFPLQTPTQIIPQQSSQNTNRPPSYTTYQKPLPNLSFQSQKINAPDNFYRSPSYLQIGNNGKTEGQLLWEKHRLTGPTKNQILEKDNLNRNKSNQNEFHNSKLNQPETHYQFKHFPEYNKMPSNQYSHPKPQNQNQPNPQSYFTNSGRNQSNNLNMKINLNHSSNTYPQFLKQKTVNKFERTNFGNTNSYTHNTSFDNQNFGKTNFGNSHFHAKTNLNPSRIGESKQNGVGLQNNQYLLYKRGEGMKLGFRGY